MQIAAPLGDFWVPSTGMLESLYANLAMPIQEKNYWLETVATPPVESARDLPEDVDVAVVGGGFYGLSAARSLAKGGVNVALFEAETFGWVASCRKRVMVLTGMQLPVSTHLKRYVIGAVCEM